MRRHGCAIVVCLLATGLAWTGGVGQDQKEDGKAAPQVFRQVPDQKLEALLKDAKVDFKKTAGDKGVSTFEFQLNKRRIKLINYGGEDLWLESLFADKLPLAKINQWNLQARHSRSVLLQGKKGEEDTVSLESQLDCLSGLTDGMIRQFLRRFVAELEEFVKFAAK